MPQAIASFVAKSPLDVLSEGAFLKYSQTALQRAVSALWKACAQSSASTSVLYGMMTGPESKAASLSAASMTLSVLLGEVLWTSLDGLLFNFVSSLLAALPTEGLANLSGAHPGLAMVLKTFDHEEEKLRKFTSLRYCGCRS